MQLQMLFGNRIHPISLLLHHCLSLSVQFWQRLRCQFGSQQQDLFPPVQQCLAGIEIWPKSYACNCQTPGAFDRFFMPFDVTFEKIQSENGNYWNSAAAQELSSSGSQLAQLVDTQENRARVQIPQRQLQLDKTSQHHLLVYILQYTMLILARSLLDSTSRISTVW